MKKWFDSNPAALVKWLDPTASEVSDEAIVPLPTELEARDSMHCDRLLRIGPGRLMQVEFETAPRKDLVRRMLEYRVRLMRAHPDEVLTQHIIVLGGQKVQGYDDLEQYGFALDLKVIHLFEHDPSEYLADPMLAPLAVLARGDRQDRVRSLTAAGRLLQESNSQKSSTWWDTAVKLAQLHMDVDSIFRAEKESTMDVLPITEYLERFGPVEEILAESRQRQLEEGREQGIEEGLKQGLEQGREQGLERGLEQGRELLLLRVIKQRFGDGPEASTAAHHLVGWNDDDAALAAIAAATDLAELQPSVPPGPA
jgi:hypothetical protein